MLARDSVVLGTKQTQTAVVRRLGQGCSAPRVVWVDFRYPVFIELISIFPKGQSQIGNLGFETCESSATLCSHHIAHALGCPNLDRALTARSRPGEQ